MKNYLLSLILGLLAPGVSLAAISINDPQQVLAQLQSKMVAADFDSLFRLSETAQFDRFVESCEISCSDSSPGVIGGCGSICKNIASVYSRTVHQLDADKAVIYGAEDGYYEEISRDDIKTCNGSLMERYLANLDTVLNLQGTLTLYKFSTFELPLAKGTPRERKVVAHSVWGDFVPTGYKSSFEVKVSFVPTAPGVGQVAMLSASGQVYFRLKDF
ncbi:hypothetical protein [Bdellovibrio sp. HCB337]|uniref:hypothetical protein n=1 Tax=Bdellovibrio sp. HCB337 TaxID=3394358 RepID=UPI0039A5D977